MHIIYSSLKNIFLFEFYCYGICGDYLSTSGSGLGYEFYDFGYGSGYPDGNGEDNSFGHGNAMSCGTGNSIGDGKIYNKSLIFEEEY